LTRLQRATEGSGESTRCCGDNVFKRARMGFEDFRRHSVVLRHCAVNSEEYGPLLGRQPCAPQSAFHALDPHSRYVRCIRHVDYDIASWAPGIRSRAVALRTTEC
jgi:hypothetical protein